jgi:hypothetical protein
MAEWPPGVTRDSARADLLGLADPALTPDRIDAMTDEELLELWLERMGAGAPGAVPAGAGAPMSEKEAGTFTERLQRAVTAGVRRELAGVHRDLLTARRHLAALSSDAARRKQAERHGAVKAFCERWRREGRVTPAEVDPGSKTPNLYHRLMLADGSRVRKYGETSATEFDALVLEIETRPIRRYGERLVDPETDGPGGNGPMSAERRRELLAHTEMGRTILRGEAKKN